MPKLITKNLVEVSALFPPKSAGRDMITEIPVFDGEASVGDAQKHLIEHGDEYKTVNYAYIVKEGGEIEGVLSVRELLQSTKQKKVKNVMHTDIVTVKPLDTIPRVALLALKHNLKMVPIVDAKNRLLGAYGADELLNILEEEFSNDLLKLSGVRVPKKHFSFEVGEIVVSRLPWMLVGMLGGLLTGMIIGVFKSSIEAVVLLAVFIPVIMSTGATSANQSAMIFLRNLMHGDIKQRIQYVFNEIKISSALGGILSVILFGFLLVYPGQPALAFAVSFSLFFTVVAGSLIGVFTPMLLNRFKLDPSTGAGPFLTIIKDLAAMAIYFTIATMLLSYFQSL